jgi:amino acid transporter
MVSGGPYGLEELIAKAGYRSALWILILTPLIWSLPTALMVGELSGAMPKSGGYYAWVRRALGPFWGFQEAWLSLAASVFDMALYPTLFVLYLGCFFPSLGSGTWGVVIGAALVAACAGWNMRGARAVGGSSLFMAVLFLLPFVLMVALAGARPSATALGSTAQSGLFAGILVAMWNYMGWDNASTVANEVERPERTYPVGMIATVALVTITYVLPLWAARRTGLDPSSWSTGSWVAAANAIGGVGLGTAVAIAGMLSAAGTFNSLVMSYSRVPVALAEDGLLPRIFAQRNAANGAPRLAIGTCAVAYACCLGLGFSRLILLDIVLYGASLLLEFIALLVLRIREPELPRRFKVPGGLFGAALVGVLPICLLVIALVASFKEGGKILELGLAVALFGAGPLIYWLRTRRLEVPAPSAP